MLEFHKDFSQGWVLTFLSSVLCVLGCFIIYTDDIYYFLFPKWITSRYPFHLKENYAFMNGSLAFSSGCLLFTALYRLLPEALNHIQEAAQSANVHQVLILSFVAGILICVLFNEALHFFTAESVVHCSHDGEDKVAQASYAELQQPHHHHHQHVAGGNDQYGNGQHSHAHTHASVSGLGPHVAHEGIPVADLELAPLLGRRKSSKLLHFFSHSTDDPQILGECKGYSSAELCLHRGHELHFCEIPELEAAPDAKPNDNDSDESSNTVSDPVAPPQALIAQQSPHHHSLHDPHDEHHQNHPTDEHHHHHVNLPLSRLLLIGIQTILAITLHKFPEGFITYITSETNPQLGVLIFLSLLIHNYTEGFSMCLPLYYSFPANSRWRKLKAVSVSALLGGLSQPLGAFGGYLFMWYYTGDNLDLSKLDQVFGISMAVTSGFLVVIALSMYGSAVSFSGLPNFVMLWCLMGMGIIGLLTVFIRNE